MQKNFTITHIGDTELSLPMPFIFIPAKGETFMFQADDGTEFGTKSEGTPITFEKDYWLCAYPTTQEFWEAVANLTTNENVYPFVGRFRGKVLPVEEISWNDIQIFNIALNNIKKITFLETNPPNGSFGLPSETQWEYAALEEPNSVFVGSQNLNDVGWYSDNSNDQTMPVGIKVSNKKGFYDMSGNVYEWCSNDYDIIMPNGESGSNSKLNVKAVKGGNSYSKASGCRVRSRNSIPPELSDGIIGFRLLFSPSSSALEG